MKSLTFGFFRASQPVGAAIQQKLIEFAAQPRPLNRSRTAMIDPDTPLVLRNIQAETDGDYLMEITRLRNASRVDISDLEGNDEQLALPPNKRPAEFTSLVFDCTTGILVVQESAMGVSPTMVSRYWHMMIPGLPRFRFDAILEQRAQDIIMAAGGFSKFTVSLAHMGNERHLGELGLPQNEVVDLVRQYGAPNISVTMSIDPRGTRRTLALEHTRELARALLGLGRRHVKKLSLVTEDDEGFTHLVNLLKDRVIERVELAADEAQEDPHEVRYRAVRSAWGSRKTELRGRYENVD